MSDALERLRNRNRPQVPARDASLVPVPSASPITDISTGRNLDKEITAIPELQPIEPKASPPSDFEISASSDIQTQEVPVPLLQTKQTTLRFEQDLSDRLQDLCREHGICREVLIEAMFEYCECHPEVLTEVLEVAQQKNEQRQHMANLKRAKSMMQRFGQMG